MRTTGDSGGGQTEHALELIGATKRFGAVTALDDVSVELRKQEILALLGDNGAGKSTFVRCISGVHRLDHGVIRVDGADVTLSSTSDAQAHGIQTVYQDLALFDNLSAAENLFAGRELTRPRWLGSLAFIRREDMNARAAKTMERLQVNIPDVSMPVGLMSGGQRQALAVARAEAFGRRIVLLDEPTAALGIREARSVHKSIERLRDQGASIVLISHNLEEVIRIADRAVVLRQGRVVGQAPAKRDCHEALVSMIVGGGTEA